MIKVINHKADSLPKALLINDYKSDEIQEICIKYFDELSITVILELVQKQYDIRGMVLASHILGQLKAQSLNKFSNQNLFKKWQRQN